MIIFKKNYFTKLKLLKIYKNISQKGKNKLGKNIFIVLRVKSDFPFPLIIKKILSPRKELAILYTLSKSCKK